MAVKIETTYLGKTLRSPLAVSANPLTDNIGNLKRMEDSGAGAIVLFSLRSGSLSVALNVGLAAAFGARRFGQVLLTVDLPQRAGQHVGAVLADGVRGPGGRARAAADRGDEVGQGRIGVGFGGGVHRECGWIDLRVGGARSARQSLAAPAPTALAPVARPHRSAAATDRVRRLRRRARSPSILARGRCRPGTRAGP